MDNSIDFEKFKNIDYANASIPELMDVLYELGKIRASNECKYTVSEANIKIICIQAAASSSNSVFGTHRLKGEACQMAESDLNIFMCDTYIDMIKGHINYLLHN